MTSHRRARNRSARIAVEPLEARELLSTIVALTAQDQLLTFDSSRPGVSLDSTTITGLQTGETILAIDTRPATGQLYGLGSTGRLYVINPNTGTSQAVSSSPIAAPLSGSEFSMSFNPVTDTLRIVSNNGEDLRVDPNTAVVTTDATLYFAPTDPNTGTSPDLIGEANSNYEAGATVSTTFGIDARTGNLVTQGSVGGAPTSANLGELFTVGSLGVNPGTVGGFAITSSGQALALFNPSSGASPALYSINLATGAASLIGNFTHNSPILDIAALQPVDTIYGVTTTNQLIAFASNTPDQILSSLPIKGLLAGESITSIAFRPATGGLYGLGSLGRLYLINPATAIASLISTGIYTPDSSAKATLSFDPTDDEFRIVDSNGEDLRGNPNTGNLIANDVTLLYALTDPAAGIPAHVVAEAYSNPFQGATSTTLYGIDSIRGALVTQGTTNVSPNLGLLYEVAPTAPSPSLGIAVNDLDGLSFAEDNQAYALLTPQANTSPTLAFLNLTTGAATTIGTIGGGNPLLDIAVAPAGVAEFSASSYDVNAATGSATITVTRINGTSGPASVSFATSDGTAQGGINYSPTSGTLNFAAGQASQTFTVPILAGNPSGMPLTVNLSLAQVTGGIAIGPIGSAVLRIENSASTPPASVATTTFEGPAGAISAVDLTFAGTVNAAEVANVVNYAVATIPLTSATYNAAANVVTLTFASSIAISQYSTIPVTVKADVINGTQIVEYLTILHGKTVRYVDSDGDHVTLSVSGKGASLDVIRAPSGEGLQAFVEGKGKVVTGALRAIRGSNHKTSLAKFVTNGAKLRLPRSIVVGQVS